MLFQVLEMNFVILEILQLKNGTISQNRLFLPSFCYRLKCLKFLGRDGLLNFSGENKGHNKHKLIRKI